MTTLTTTSNNETASVTLDILKTTDVAKVVRTNVNGTEEVRVSQGQLPSPTISAIVRTNLVTNPSFETDLNGYAPLTADTSLSRVTSGGLFGGSFMRLTTTAPIKNRYSIRAQTSDFTLTGGKTYTFTFHFRHTIPLAYYSVIYPTIVGAGSYSSSSMGDSQVNGWMRANNTITIPGTGPQTVHFEFGAMQYAPVGSPDVPTGTTIDFDGVLLEEGSTIGEYFDGSTPDISGFDYLWTGTANASTSTLQTVGGRLILTDYEAAHGLNTYNVYAADGSMATGSATLVIDKPWLSVPVMPQYSEQVETITQFGAGRESNTTVHRPLGRADSLVVMGKLGDRTGSLEIFCNSYTDARRLERVFERGEIVQLRQRVEELDMYFTATSIPVSPYAVEGETDTKWAMRINYVEVRRPIGDLAGALGWTFDQLSSSATSFSVITQSYATFDALTLGDANV